MFNRTCITSLALLGLGFLFLTAGAIRTQEIPRDDSQNRPAAAGQDGMEVLARGPVHEAFAEPSIRGPRPSPIIPKKPPDPIEELPPDQKPEGNNIQWIPGYWAWDEDRQGFLWVSGVWRDLPPGKQWAPGTWSQVEDGWQWVAGYWADTNQAEVNFLPAPPDPVAEAVSDQAAADSSYVPGCWIFTASRYQWRPGFWLTMRPGWVWMPAHYLWTPAGYVFVDGFWDYPLQNRGLLFAPVFFQQPLWTQPNWVYQPTFVVQNQFLLGALFVRTRNCHYYFGDYFEDRYSQLGFISWVDFRASRMFPDPLFSYYRWNFRANPRWANELRDLYVARREGVVARPPRTVSIQQANTIVNNRTTIVNNIQNISLAPAANITDIRNVAPVASLKQVSQSLIRMQPLRGNQLQDERKLVRQFQEVTRQRATLESQIRGKAAAAGDRTGEAQPIRVKAPRVNVASTNKVTTKVPPRPTMPRPQAQTEGGNAVGRPGTNRLPDERTPRQPGRSPEEGVRPETPRRPQDQVRPVIPRQPEERPRPGTEPRPGTRPPANNRPGEEPRPRPSPTPEPRPAPNRPPEERRPSPPPESRPAPRPESNPRPAPRPEPNRPPEERRANPAPRPEPSRPPAEHRQAAPAPEPRPAPRPPPPRPPEERRPNPAPAPRPAPNAAKSNEGHPHPPPANEPRPRPANEKPPTK